MFLTQAELFLPQGEMLVTHLIVSRKKILQSNKYIAKTKQALMVQ